MKPEIGSKWRCEEQYGSVERGEEITVTGFHGRGPDATDFVDFTSRRGAGAMYLSRLDGRQFVPLSPAPAEPAKAAGWKKGDRFTVSGFVEKVDGSNGAVIAVQFDGSARVYGGWSMQPAAALRPEAAPPAAAPAVTGKVDQFGHAILADDRNLLMQLADVSSKRDQFEALSVKRELELGDKERENARLSGALRDATARLRKVGRL